MSMFRTMTRMMRWLSISLILLVGCSAPVEPAPTPTLAPTPEPTPIGRLTVSLLYPKQDTEMEMGQSTRFIAQVTDVQGDAVRDAQVVLTVRNPSGKIMGAIPAVSASDGVYRTASWTIPHRTLEGAWSVTVDAGTDSAQGNGSGSFKIKNSTSEVLLNKYGFWLDAPTLQGIVPQLYAEKGDAQNGMILWGGIIPAQHVQPENWVQINWREGDYKLTDPEAVRRFMLEQVGDLGLTPVRNIGPFQPIQFKHWDAWRMGARGQFTHSQIEWVIFYASQANKTYAIGTTVVLPPASVDPHAMLRDSFAVLPDVHASGAAPEPLPKLLPGPELISPPLNSHFQGLGQRIVLQWQPVKELAPDEYYEVVVDYNYRESNPNVKLITRQTHVTLPETLYQTPNCRVFNWQVTLERQTGVDDSGQPKGEPISYNSLYWYLWWQYPPGEKEPFIVACPNEQF